MKDESLFSKVVVYWLIVLLVVNVLWFFYKKPLSDNINIRNATAEIRISMSESRMSNENGTGYEIIDSYSYSGTIDEKSVQDLIDVMDNIPSRKRNAGIGGVTMWGGSVNANIEIMYFINDQFVYLVMTNEKDVMYDRGTENSSITLKDGNFEKLAEVIRQYGAK